MSRRYLRKAIRALTTSIVSLTLTPDALDNHSSNMKGRNRDYSKFVVLSHERSGSSLLIGTLRNHPLIIGFGELFSPRRIVFNVEGYNNLSIKLLALRNKYPIDFLEKYVFSSYQEDIKAVGFKLFPQHIDNDRFRCLWHWLNQNRDLKIIFLTRTNMLATYTSLLVALKDKRFSIKDESERTTTTITIDPNKCLAQFQEQKHYNEEAKKCIEHHEVLDITYEELAIDPYIHLNEAHNFLGIEVCDLELSSVKQEIRPLSEIIDNYDELRRHFLGTEWKYLFDDQ